MKFEYKKYGPNAIRPIIPIELFFSGKKIQYEALVDSGADFCIFDVEIGQAIGLDVYAGEKKQVFGITGNPQYYYLSDVTLRVGGWDYKTKVGFSSNISTDGYGVLGQIGFFEFFKVTFDYTKQAIEVKEVNKK